MIKLKPYLYKNGGPVIMVQVEHEYGLVQRDDEDYIKWLKKELGIHSIRKSLKKHISILNLFQKNMFLTMPFFSPLIPQMQLLMEC